MPCRQHAQKAVRVQDPVGDMPEASRYAPNGDPPHARHAHHRHEDEEDSPDDNDDDDDWV
jgi:hypothetical protein